MDADRFPNFKSKFNLKLQPVVVKLSLCYYKPYFTMCFNCYICSTNPLECRIKG